MAEDAHKESWHLSKNVPIALILALLIQAGGAIWWGSKIDSHVSLNRERIVENRAAIGENRNAIGAARSAAQQQAVQLSRIEEHLRGLQRTLDSIAADMRRSQ